MKSPYCDGVVQHFHFVDIVFCVDYDKIGSHPQNVNIVGNVQHPSERVTPDNSENRNDIHIIKQFNFTEKK